jgi:hypothetical protein
VRSYFNEKLAALVKKTELTAGDLFFDCGKKIIINTKKA